MFVKNFWEYVRINSASSNQCSSSNTAFNARLNCDIYGLVGGNTDYSRFSSIYIDSFRSTGTPHYYPTNPSGDSDYQTALLLLRHIFYGITVAVGSGTTDVTSHDYKLEDDKTSSFDTTSTTSTYSTNEDGHFVLKLTWFGRNKTVNPITISEVGGWKWLPMYNGGVTWAKVFIARHKLSTPITINGGDSATIIFECEIY